MGLHPKLFMELHLVIDIWKTPLFDTMALFPPNINAVGTVLTQHLEKAWSQFERLLEKPGVHEKRDIHPFLNETNFLLHPNPSEVFSTDRRLATMD